MKLYIYIYNHDALINTEMVLSNIIHFVYFSLGSCIEQGLTTCAGGFFAGCFCDQACLSLRDCCTDIYQLDYCGAGKLCCHLKISEFKKCIIITKVIFLSDTSIITSVPLWYVYTYNFLYNILLLYVFLHVF